jgi:hypothetical protein
VSAWRGRGPWWWTSRAVLLLVTGVSLYLLAPGLIALFSSWHELTELKPEWLAAAVGFMAMSFVSLWEVQRIAMRTPSWFAVGTSQLLGNAMGSIIPGGAATSSAFSYRMLVRAGVEPGAVASGVTASFLATTAAVFLLPVLAVPAVIGAGAPHGLLTTAYIGIAAFILLVGVGSFVLFWDPPLIWLGRAARWAMGLIGKGDSVADLPARLVHQRDEIRLAFGTRWKMGVLAAVGNRGFDYIALVCCVSAVGARPNPSLLLLAYAAQALLRMIPFTPGGLGFVETGLTGLLALAGVSAQQAVVATLAYRLIQFWLPLPIGGVAALLHRRRYGSSTPVSIASPP